MHSVCYYFMANDPQRTNHEANVPHNISLTSVLFEYNFLAHSALCNPLEYFSHILVFSSDVETVSSGHFGISLDIWT